MPRRRAWSPRHSTTSVLRHRAWNSRLKHEVQGTRLISRQWENTEFEARNSAPPQCPDVNFEARISNITAVLRHRAWGSHLHIIAVPKCRARRLCSAQTRSSRPVSSIISMAKCGAQSRFSTGEESSVSVMITPITESSTAHVIRRVNPSYRGFLWDSFTPVTLINSSVCYWRAWNFSNWERLALQRVQLFYINLLSSSFYLSLFEILLDRSCATPSVIQGEEFWRNLTFTYQQKIRFTFHRYTPVLNKEEIWTWVSSLSLVVGIWVLQLFIDSKKICNTLSTFLPVHL